MTHTNHLLLVVVVLPGLLEQLLWLLAALAQGDQGEMDKMEWIQAENQTALCNDFTRAGFFIRRNQSSNDWIIFLESGGLCYSTETCNRRFFVRKVSYVE